MASPTDCNQSLCSYNTNDYIDLKEALTEEELSHSTNSRTNSREASYKYTLNSMDDTELDQFRRSLVTPLSANYKSQDPMYNKMVFNNNRKLNSISPTNSITTDTAESVALFNRISNDEHKDVEDFVKTDLKDYMGSFNLDDLISRPGSGSNARSPLPPLSNRYNRQSPLLQLHQRQQYHHQDTKCTANKINNNTNINLDNINKVTPSTKPPPSPTTNLKYNALTRKLSFDTSVLTASNSTINRRASLSEIQPTKEEEKEEGTKDIPTRSRRADSIKQDKLVKRLSLLTLKEKTSSPSSGTQQQSTLRKLQQQQPTAANNSSTNNRRWSSYVPDQQQIEGNNTVESKLDQLRSNSINKQQAANTEQRYGLLISSSSRYKERRTSTSSNNDNNNSCRILPAQVTSSSARYTSSKRNSILADQQQPQPQQRENAISARDITTSSRYAQRRISASSNRSNVDNRSKTLTTALSSATRYVERRTSYHGDPAPASSNTTVTNKRASYHAGVVSSGYGQQRSPSIKPISTTAAANEKNLQQQRRVRALSVPSSDNDNHYSVEQPLKPSLIAVPVSRYRKISNGSLSRSNNIPENEAVAATTIPAKEVRFSSTILIKKRNSTSSIEGVQLVASRNTGGYSNLNTSSHSSSGGYGQLRSPTIKPANTAIYAGVSNSGYGQQRSPSIKPISTAAAANEKNLQQQRRVRALSVPTSDNDNHYSVEQPLKPSLIAVPVSRYRKISNGSLSRSNNIPENEAVAATTIPAKEVRFSSTMLIKKRNSTSGIEGVQLVASRSTGGYSNSTTSSSHSSSGDLEYYDPPTPPYLDYDKRRSIPVYKEAASPPQQQQQSTRSKKYNDYLERLKDTYGVKEEEEDNTFSVVTTAVAAPADYTRRQHVGSEDNEHHYYKQKVNRQPSVTSQVTNNARQVLAHLQEKRARTAAYLYK